MTGRSLERLMLYADAVAVMPQRYRKRIREIAKFAADCAAEKLQEARHVRGYQSGGAGNGSARVPASGTATR